MDYYQLYTQNSHNDGTLWVWPLAMEFTRMTSIP